MGQRTLSCRGFGLFVALVCAMLLAACGGDGGGGGAPAPSIASVTIGAPTTSPKEGDAVQLTAVARDQYGAVVPGTTTTWSVSDTRLAAISTEGILNAYHEGSVVATAAVNGVSGTQTFTISPIRVSVTIGSTKEVVFQWATDRCDDRDTPDLPTHIVRAEDGSLVLFAGNSPRFYVSRGPDFNSLKRDCSHPVLESADRRTPESYENMEWISAVYREGSRWHALISNEFHDAVAATCSPGNPNPGNPCWYNSITYSVSTDGARSFGKPAAPAHVVAPPPYVWEPPLPGALPNTGGQFVEGYFGAFSILRKDDGYFYAIVGLTPSKSGPYAGQCLLRTNRLDDPASWRAWDGTGFNDRFTSPYVTGNPAPMCKVTTGLPTGLITFNTYLNRYVNLDTWNPIIDGKRFCSFAFSLSADLLHWSAPQLITQPGDAVFCLSDSARPGFNAMYPTLIDHEDTTTNFERPGRTPHLYYVRFNRGTMDDPLYWVDRDLVRVPLTFTRLD